MILHLKASVDANRASEIAAELKAAHVILPGGHVLVTSAKVKSVDSHYDQYIQESFVMESDIQLASRKYLGETRTIHLGDGLTLGGSSHNTVFMTGPCSVESKEQITQAAELCVSLGVKVLRGGCYKPRTSPYTFQGLGLEGLMLLVEMREKYGLKIISEVRDFSHVDEVIEHVDVIQIGAKAMYDHGILKACGKARKPVLLKRGFGSTLQEFVQAAEFILSGGNEQVILCERGIRTFETKTRFTLDLCGVAYLKEYTNLPIVLDPSHAMGYRYGVADLSRACTAMGVDGLLIEAHPNPNVAKSDADQQLDFPALRALHATLGPIATAVGRNFV
ncbi:MAG: bifunctional 3-deoxy-7-phosphoheptulonate synthase/chorismate mutase [Bacteroidia bacterium]|nr:bifunctional 3-deoxy-7-phosphoheptulonate synthase/chorismate mutase [Bacteroidia bacterium]